MARHDDSVTQFVYGLMDPRDNRVRYIGLSVDPVKRLKRHFASCHIPAMKEWLRELRSARIAPEIKILDSTKGELRGHWLEKNWIKEYSNTHPGDLFNRLWLGNFVYLYSLRSSAAFLKREIQRKQWAEFHKRIDRARAAARRHLTKTDGNIDGETVRKLATKYNVARSIIWSELYAYAPQPTAVA